MLEGALLRHIADFLDPAGIFSAGSTLLAWRALSRQDRDIVNGVVAYADAGQVVYRARTVVFVWLPLVQ